MTTKWIKETIAEPFPVFFSHVARKSEAKRETAKGPFCAAGSSFYHVYTERNLAWRQWAAERIRAAGWTVTLEIIER